MYHQKYDGRLCGLGKTTEQHTAINNSTDKFLVSSPTKALNKEQNDGINDSLVIDSDSIKWYCNVKHELEQSMSISQQRSIVVTHAALPRLLENAFSSAWKITSNRHLIIDESLDQFCVKEVSYNLSYEVAGLLLSLLSFEETSLSPELLEIIPSNEQRLREWSNGATGCAVLTKASPLKTIARDVLNPMYHTLISKTTKKSFIDKSANERTAQLSFVSILKPEALDNFKSVTNLSALFPMTEYAQIMLAQGVEFEDITPMHSPSDYPDSDRVHLHYYTENNWTSELRTKKDDKNKTNIDKIVAHVKSVVGDNPFIFNAHTEDRKTIERINDAELVTETHGRNDLRDYTKAAFLGSRNITPQLAEVVKHLGIDRIDMDMARTVLAGYQFFMRTDLRNRGSKNRVDLFCCDRRMVDFMLRMFPDAHVEIHNVNLQITKLDDLRVNNGGSRTGSGRKQQYPEEWPEAAKTARRRYMAGAEAPLSEKEWYEKSKYSAQRM